MWNPFTPKVKQPNTPLQGEAERLASPLNTSNINNIIPPPPSFQRSSESKEEETSVDRTVTVRSPSLRSPLNSNNNNMTNLENRKVPAANQNDLLSIIGLAGPYLSYSIHNNDITLNLQSTVTNHFLLQQQQPNNNSNRNNTNGNHRNTNNALTNPVYSLQPNIFPGPLHLSSYQLPLTHTQASLRSDIQRNSNTTMSVQVDILHTVFSPSFTLLSSGASSLGSGNIPSYRVLCSLLTNDNNNNKPVPSSSLSSPSSVSSSTSSSVATYHDVTPAYPLQYLFGSSNSSTNTSRMNNNFIDNNTIGTTGIPYILYHQSLMVSSSSSFLSPSLSSFSATNPTVLQHPNPSPVPFTIRLQITFDNTSINLPSTVGALHIPPTSIIASVDIDLTMVPVTRTHYPLRIRWLPSSIVAASLSTDSDSKVDEDNDTDDNYIFMDILLHMLSNPNQSIIEQHRTNTLHTAKTTINPLLLSSSSSSAGLSTASPSMIPLTSPRKSFMIPSMNGNSDTNIASIIHPLYQSRIFDPVLFLDNGQGITEYLYISSLENNLLKERNYWLQRRKQRTVIPNLPNGANSILNGRTWPWKNYQRLPTDFWNPPKSEILVVNTVSHIYSSIAVSAQMTNISFTPTARSSNTNKGSKEISATTVPKVRVILSLLSGTLSMENNDATTTTPNTIVTDPLFMYDATGAQPIFSTVVSKENNPLVIDTANFYEALLVYQKGYYDSLKHPVPIFIRIQVIGEEETASRTTTTFDGLDSSTHPSVNFSSIILASTDIDMTLVPLNTNITLQLFFSSFLQQPINFPYTNMTMDITFTLLSSPNLPYVSKHTIISSNTKTNQLSSEGTVQIVIHKADILYPSSSSSGNDDKTNNTHNNGATNGTFNLSVTQSNSTMNNNDDSSTSNLALMSLVANNYEHQQQLFSTIMNNPSSLPKDHSTVSSLSSPPPPTTTNSIIPRTLSFALRTIVTSSSSSSGYTNNHQLSDTALMNINESPRKIYVDVHRIVPPNGILDILSMSTMAKFTMFDLPSLLTNILPVGYTLQEQISSPILSYSRASSGTTTGNSNRNPAVVIGTPVYSGCSGSSITSSVPLSSQEFPPSNSQLVLQIIDVQANYGMDDNENTANPFPVRTVPIGRVLASAIVPYPTDVFENSNNGALATTASSTILCTRKSYTSFPLFHPEDIDNLPLVSLTTAVPSHIPILAQIQCLVSLWTGIRKVPDPSSSPDLLPITIVGPQDNLISREITTITSLFTERASMTSHTYFSSLLKSSSLASSLTDTLLSSYPWLTFRTSTLIPSQRNSRSNSISSERSLPHQPLRSRIKDGLYTEDQNGGYDYYGDMLSGKTRSPGSRERLNKLLGDTASMSVAAALTFGSTKEVGKAGEDYFGNLQRSNSSSILRDSIDPNNPSPVLIKKLIFELDRRTDALRITGEEILQLRKQLRLSQENYQFLQNEYKEKVQEQTKADDQILLQALRDIGPSALLAAPNSPGFNHLTTLSATQILQHLQNQDPTGTTVVPNLIRRLTVLAQRFVQERRANTALTSEVTNLKTRIKTLEKETAALIIKATMNTNYDKKTKKNGSSNTSNGISSLSSTASLDTSLDGSTITSSLPLLTNENTNLIVNYDGTLMHSAFPINPPAPIHGTKDSLTSHLIMAETAMGLGVGGLLPGQAEAMILARYANAPSGQAASVTNNANSNLSTDPFGPYTSTLVTGNSLLDPAAPVSALTHAKLLDAYAAAVNEMDSLRSTTARAHAHAKEISDAHQASMVAIQTLQAEVRDNSVLKSTVKNQQALIQKLEQALEKTHQRIAGASKKEHLLRKEIEKRDIAIHRGMNPEYEGDLTAHLRAKDARISILEDEMKATTASYAVEISRAQTRIVELEEQMMTGNGKINRDNTQQLPLTKVMNAASVPKLSLKDNNVPSSDRSRIDPNQPLSRIDPNQIPNLTNQLETDLQAIDAMLNNLGLLDGGQTQAEDYLRYPSEALSSAQQQPYGNTHSNNQRPPSVQSVGLGISALLHPSRGSTPYHDYGNNYKNITNVGILSNDHGSSNSSNNNNPSSSNNRPPLPTNQGLAPSRRISSTSQIQQQQQQQQSSALQQSSSVLPSSSIVVSTGSSSNNSSSTTTTTSNPFLPSHSLPPPHRPSITVDNNGRNHGVNSNNSNYGTENMLQSPSVSMMIPPSNPTGGRSRAPSKLSLDSGR